MSVINPFCKSDLHFICNVLVFHITKITKIFCISLSSKPIAGYCNFRISRNLIHFVRQCVCKYIKRALIIKSIYRTHKRSVINSSC